MAGVREVDEETGVRVRLGVPLTSQAYPNGARTKVVDYWVGRVVGDHDVSGYLVNDEIDEVAWVEVDKAAGRLSYRRDRETLREALASGKKTRALAILRHGQARSRKAWRKDDRTRPLLVRGTAQARAAAPVLGRVRGDPDRHLVQHPLRRDRRAVRRAQRPAGDRHRRALRGGRDGHEGARGRRRAARLAVRTPCCARTGRSCRRSTTRSGSRAEPHATGELVVVHHRRGRVRALERHLG